MSDTTPHRCFSDGYFIDGKPHCQICGELIDNSPREAGGLQILQIDRDIANELSQNLGTLAQDFRNLRGSEALEGLETFDRACLERAAQLFARHRATAAAPAIPTSVRERIADIRDRMQVSKDWPLVVNWINDLTELEYSLAALQKGTGMSMPITKQ